MLMVMHPDHPCAGIGQIDDLTPFEDELMMISPTGEPMRKILDGFFKLKNFAPRHILETNNAEFCLNMIAEGVGISIISEMIRGLENARTIPAYARFIGAPPTLITSVAHLRRRYLSIAARAFLRELEGFLSQPS
jgi:DNA-binding transcriptional LysR family regulator